MMLQSTANFLCITFHKTAKSTYVSEQSKQAENSYFPPVFWVKGKVKGKGHPRTGHEGPDVE
jgi:hypothetical protein